MPHDPKLFSPKGSRVLLLDESIHEYHDEVGRILTRPYADAQNPLPSGVGDSTYYTDLYLPLCDPGDFVGDIDDLLGKSNFTTTLVNSTTDNPKTIVLRFKRPILTSFVGVGTITGDFSNMRITAASIVGPGAIIYDNSADDTSQILAVVPLVPINYFYLTLEFFTADTVSISGILAEKNQYRVSRLQAQSESTGLVENIQCFEGALNVTDGLVHKRAISRSFAQLTGTSTTPATAISAGDTVIDFTSTAGFAVGSLFYLSDATAYDLHPYEITDIVANDVTIDHPTDNAYGTAASIEEAVINMSVDGSVAPVSFKLTPPAYETWQVTRIIISMLDSSAMDDGKFGGLPELDNGVVVRSVRGAEAQTATIWKNNGDMAGDMYDVTYIPDSKGPAGQFGLRGRWTFTKMGVIIELKGSEADYAEILIQDDLTDLDSFKIEAQGRIFGN